MASRPARHSRLLILGSGPPAIRRGVAARANLKPVLVAGIAQGGQLMTTTDVDNWPADADGVQVPISWSASAARGPSIRRLPADHIHKAHFDRRRSSSRRHGELQPATPCIIATGASAKYLGPALGAEFMGAAVSACATCDGFFYKGQDVVVVAAATPRWKRRSTSPTSRAMSSSMHRRDKFRAEKIMQDKLMKRVAEGKIGLVLDAVVYEVLDDIRASPASACSSSRETASATSWPRGCSWR